jgi:hypothetical protein
VALLAKIDRTSLERVPPNTRGEFGIKDGVESSYHDDGQPSDFGGVTTRRARQRVAEMLLGQHTMAALSPDVAVAGEAPSAAQLMDDLMRNRGPQRGTVHNDDHQGKRRSSTEFASSCSSPILATPIAQTSVPWT